MKALQRLGDIACEIYASTLGRLGGHRIVLCYHSVRDRSRPVRGWLGPHRSVDAQVFEQQMKWLSENTEPVSLDKLLLPGAAGNKIQVAVTFDDGYFDNIDVAIPIMRRHRIPLTWFVATDYVNDPSLVPWWDLIDYAMVKCSQPIELNDEAVAGSYNPSVPGQRAWLNTELRRILKSSDPDRRKAIVDNLTEEISRQAELPLNSFSRSSEIAEVVAAGGVELGGHTASHPNITRCSQVAKQIEIQHGTAQLEAMSDRQPNWFAYPFGGKGAYDDASAKAVESAGYRGALTLVPGLVRPGEGQYFIPRIPISPAVSPGSFKARVSGAPLFVALARLREMVDFRPGYGH